MLVFESCDGFLKNSFHMLCCTAANCQIQYSKELLFNLGYGDIAKGMDYLTCHDVIPRPPLQVTPRTSKKHSTNVTVIATAVTVLLGSCVAIFVVYLLVRRRAQNGSASDSDTAGCKLPFPTGVCASPTADLCCILEAAKRRQRISPVL
jgi:hypothetical protein